MKPTAAQLAKFNADNAWRGTVERARWRNPVRRMLDHTLECSPGEYTLQLPLYVLPLNDNGTRYARGDNADSPKKQRKMVWDCCLTQLRGVPRERVRELIFERYTPHAIGLDDHDNLPSSFKYACDAMCAWVILGHGVIVLNARKIGGYDDIFKRTGGTICNDRQKVRQHAHGIRITLRLGESRLPTPG